MCRGMLALCLRLRAPSHTGPPARVRWGVRTGTLPEQSYFGEYAAMNAQIHRVAVR